MAYARRYPVKKTKLKTFGKFAEIIWKMFTILGENNCRIDVVFDLYYVDSIESHERQRRATHDVIIANIDPSDQPLPVEIEKFWTLSENKIQFQEFFIGWVSNTYKGENPVYQGGCLISSLQYCVKVSQGTVEQFPLLKCPHEEADDRMMYHITQALYRLYYQRVLCVLEILMFL